MLGRILNALRTRARRARYAPNIEVERPTRPLLRLGSEYGGWTFDEAPDLDRCTILSFGLGEDGSFDVEFAAKFAATVIVIDPTPRSVDHFRAITNRIGLPRETGYSKSGKQPVAGYPLDKLSRSSLVLEPTAVWVEKTTIKFFAPKDPAHVSHSIVNFQNDYSVTSPSIAVPADTFAAIATKHGVKNFPLVKFDIEGAETRVVPDMLASGFAPRQLLLEMDELTTPSQRSKQAAEALDRTLRQAGYACWHRDDYTNFLYVRRA